MNAATPAYSVSSFTVSALLLLTLTLAGFPASVFVFAQAPEDDNQAVTIDSVEETASTTEEIEVEVVTSPDPRNHPYKIDKLKGGRAYSDFVVGPGRFDLQIAPGETRTVEMIITNRMGIPKTFLLTTEDMTASDDDSGAVKLLGEEVGPYTLKDFISVPQTSFVLENAERAHIPVTISIPADAEPGGFYGSLLTQIISEDKTADGGGVRAGSKIVSRIGTLFFITTPGLTDFETELKSFSTANRQMFFTKGPINFGVVIENKGTVHVKPYGQLRIFNTLGNEVGYVELQPWFILPNSVRNKEVTWDREFLVGRYTAELTLNRGYDDIIDTVKYSFWVIPLELVAAVFGTFFVLFILLRFFFSRFEFKRKGS